jgi:hypothetical protein
MVKLEEYGYTPNNLKKVLDFLGWTQKELSLFFKVSEPTVRRWLHKELTSKSHADMPLIKWQILYDLALKKPTNGN